MDRSILTEDQKDALQELMNISFGTASSIISDSLNSFSKMPLPNIEAMGIEELEVYFARNFDNITDCYIVTQLFRNKFDGESVFIIDDESARKITSLLLDEENLAKEDIQASVLELTNIISSACIGKLIELLDAQIFFNPPMIESSCRVGERVLRLSKKENMEFTKVIIIETKLEFENEQIKGYLLFLTKESSFEWLKSALDKFLEGI
jgi:chemotaxis protein CheC